MYGHVGFDDMLVMTDCTHYGIHCHTRVLWRLSIRIAVRLIWHLSDYFYIWFCALLNKTETGEKKKKKKVK